jgi:hypothetical protein
MMALVARSLGARWLPTVVVCAALVAVGLGVVGLGVVASRDPRAEVVDTAAATGWKVIEYEGVRIDVPAHWVRLGQADCEFRFERWGPPGTGACGYDGGVAFYGAATFDPSHGPGVQRSESGDEPPWGGYAYAGEFAVYVSDEDRSVVTMILRSAEPFEEFSRQ